MGLRRNIVASYLSQGYITIVSIATMPFYLRYLGAEAYGLVGFFAMLQAWFMLLDMGLTPTLARETARFHASSLNANDYGTFVWIIELMFFATAAVGGALLFLGASYLAHHWLQVTLLSISEVERALRIIAIIVALRWMSGLYRSVISGSERLIWLGNFGCAVATIRFVGVLAALRYIDGSATVFFSYQLAVAALEFLVLERYAARLRPGRPANRWALRAAFATVKPLVRFSLSLAATASVWILVTQTDKLILSKVLPLAEYGYFTLAVLVAGGVMVISGPISAAIMPRMAALEARGDLETMIGIYRRSTQFVVVVAASASLTLALSAGALLFAWTGNRTLADHAAPTLVLYALGNGILAISAFPYYLQYARGNMRMHLVGSALFVLVLIPLLVWGARWHGGQGAGAAWLATNALYLSVWVPLTHRALQPGLNRRWFSRDVLAITGCVALVGVALSGLLSDHDVRWLTAVKIGLMFGAMVAAGAAMTEAGSARLRSATARSRRRFA
jgi:O-antigen/teichoic acid export membrane protein